MHINGTSINKKDLSERDICSKFIGPAVKRAGWDGMMQIREEVAFTKGRIIVRGKLVTRGKAKRADYILYYKPNIPIAIIEAKDNNHSVGDGMQQALDYAVTLNIPFVFSSNGDGFVFHDRTGHQRREGSHAHARRSSLRPSSSGPNTAPGKDSRRTRKRSSCRITSMTAAARHRATTRAMPSTPRSKPSPRARTAFCSSWPPAPARPTPRFRSSGGLWKAGRKKRILFLADRNVLVDQTMVNDFRPFGAAMAKLSTGAKTIEREDGSEVELTTALDKKRRIDTAYEVYLGLYQAITGPEERQKLFREFSPGFFDLIVIDECHRGSAADDAAWREILEYFSAATQIGLTATPKETKYVSNIHYFGKPVYTYSLKQGIEDGFLAPYKVIKVHIDVDVAGLPAGEGRHGPRRQ